MAAIARAKDVHLGWKQTRFGRRRDELRMSDGVNALRTEGAPLLPRDHPTTSGLLAIKPDVAAHHG